MRASATFAAQPNMRSPGTGPGGDDVLPAARLVVAKHPLPRHWAGGDVFAPSAPWPVEAPFGHYRERFSASPVGPGRLHGSAAAPQDNRIARLHFLFPGFPFLQFHFLSRRIAEFAFLLLKGKLGKEDVEASYRSLRRRNRLRRQPYAASAAAPPPSKASVPGSGVGKVRAKIRSVAAKVAKVRFAAGNGRCQKACRR